MTDADDESSTGNIYANFEAAAARTATRGLALYFSRPVRLFRPSKISGWHSLKNAASATNAEFGASFLTSLVKREGVKVIPKHFLPPMIINAALGTVLWTTYSNVYDRIQPMTPDHPTTAAAISGAVAGAAQSVVAAPAENVRLLLEGGRLSGSWSHAWKEVFRGTSPLSAISRSQQREDVRQVRAWMHEVRDLAGNGWKGWSWGFGKDCCGFAVFFAIFDLTRRMALTLRARTEAVTSYRKGEMNLPRAVHAITLVAGGVTAGLAYEIVCRPWDVARRSFTLEKLASNQTSPIASLVHKMRRDGVMSLFQDPTHRIDHTSGTHLHRRIVGVLRTFSRVGPWGAGFLVYEIYGHGLN